jgi:membrane protease YdiL (CAAX protease family)
VTKTNSTIAEFFSFLANPSHFFNKKNTQTPYQRLFFVLKLVSLGLIIGILINFISSYISGLAGFNQNDNNIVSRDLKVFPPLIALLLVTVIGPLLEELAFRLYFTTQRAYFFFGLNFFIYYIWVFIGGIFNLRDSFLYSSTSTFVVIGIIFGVTTICSILVPAKLVEKMVTKYFNIFVYASGIIFGLIHITNYENYIQYFYLIPLLVLPQIFVSFLFTFVRTKLNFIWGFVCHSLYNFVLAIPLFALSIFVGNDRSDQIIDILTNKNVGDSIATLSQTEKYIISGINLFSLTIYLSATLILGYTLYEFIISYKVSSKQNKTL